MSVLEVRKISQNFDKKSLAQLTDISFQLKVGEVFSIIGPSGTGKSTLLNIIQGDLLPDAGEVLFNNEPLVSSDFKNDDLLKNFSYVPQVSTLDEEKTIFENITTPLIGIVDELSAENRVREMIEIFGLEYKDHKMPKDLSAGQRQRVEFAKALVRDPKVLLLDEPFSSLDQFLKEEVIAEVFPIFKERKISVIFITHNLEEAFSISDRTMVLSHGKSQQVCAPHTIYQRPANVFIARFTGKINLLASNVVRIEEDGTVVKNSLGEFKVNDFESSGKKFVYLATRPENVLLCSTGKISGKIKKVEFRGGVKILHVGTLDRNNYLISVPGFEKYSANQKVRFNIDPDRAFFLPI